MAASNLDALTRDALDFYLFPLVSKQDVRSDGPMIFTSAERLEITDAGGKTYLDMMSSHTRASSLGYGQERIARAIYDQLMQLHYAGTIANVVDVTVNLSAKMAELAPGSLTASVFAGSGSEANEMSIKLAKQYHIAKGDKPHAHKIISRWDSYHRGHHGRDRLHRLSRHTRHHRAWRARLQPYPCADALPHALRHGPLRGLRLLCRLSGAAHHP